MQEERSTNTLALSKTLMLRILSMPFVTSQRSGLQDRGVCMDFVLKKYTFPLTEFNNERGLSDKTDTNITVWKHWTGSKENSNSSCRLLRLSLLTRRALFPVSSCPSLQLHPLTSWSASWWSPPPDGCSAPAACCRQREASAGRQDTAYWSRLSPAKTFSMLLCNVVSAIVCVCVHLVVCIQLLVLSLTLPEGLPLGFQRLGQVGVFQALLWILLWQHLDLPLEGAQLLPETQHHDTLRGNPTLTDSTTVLVQRQQAVLVTAAQNARSLHFSPTDGRIS